MDVKTLIFLTVSCKMALFQNVVSEICLDARNITYTVQCNYEQCHIPGQYCDQSDSNFHRCATCDEDVCNQETVPGECTVPCLVYSIRNKQEENNENIQNDCFTEDKIGGKERTYLPVMITSLAFNGVFVLAVIVGAVVLFVRKHPQGHQTVIDHPQDDVNDDKTLTIAISNSKENVEEITNAKLMSDRTKV